MNLKNYLLNINPFLIGTWILRYTNDLQLKNGNSYLILNLMNISICLLHITINL